MLVTSKEILGSRELKACRVFRELQALRVFRVCKAFKGLRVNRDSKDNKVYKAVLDSHLQSLGITLILLHFS